MDNSDGSVWKRELKMPRVSVLWLVLAFVVGGIIADYVDLLGNPEGRFYFHKSTRNGYVKQIFACDTWTGKVKRVLP